MKRTRVCWFLGLAVILALLLTACAVPKPTATPAPTPTHTRFLLPTPTPTPILYKPGQEEEFKVGLAKHLQSVGAVLYVSEGCGYCKKQKGLFGDALEYINVVLCYGPVEMNPQRQVCMDKEITAVPTWEIEGEFHRGLQSLASLAELTGYEFQPAGP